MKKIFFLICNFISLQNYYFFRLPQNKEKDCMNVNVTFQLKQIEKMSSI
ncbi:hypothetical protein KBB68_01425 [Candidatus Babeliales bacterium]|nr:hypothetical protein [Candidatus Babeliales bacterium]